MAASEAASGTHAPAIGTKSTLNIAQNALRRLVHQGHPVISTEPDNVVVEIELRRVGPIESSVRFNPVANAHECAGNLAYHPGEVLSAGGFAEFGIDQRLVIR